MASPRASVGQRWLIRGLGWRIIVGIRSDKHGRLYGVRSTVKNYPLTPVSAYDKNQGRFVRSRDLLRRDKRRKAYRIVSRYEETQCRPDGTGPYVWVNLWNGARRMRMYEHRFIMQQAMGRRLTTNEIVHHRNGDSKDNRMENLQLCSRREHPQMHAEMRRRYEIEMRLLVSSEVPSTIVEVFDYQSG